MLPKEIEDPEKILGQKKFLGQKCFHIQNAERAKEIDKTFFRPNNSYPFQKDFQNLFCTKKTCGHHPRMIRMVTFIHLPEV